MTAQFTKVAAFELARATDALQQGLSQVDMEATGHGAFGGSRMYITHQTAMLDHLRAYAAQLVRRLTEIDVHHTPYRSEDFDHAASSFVEFRERLSAIYQERRARDGPFGSHPPDLDTRRFDIALKEGTNDISIRKQEFVSRRSFWKQFRRWAVEDLARRGFILIVSAASAAVGALAWELLGGP